MKNRNLIISLIVLLSTIAVLVMVGMFFLIGKGTGFMRFGYRGKMRISNQLVLDDVYDNDFNKIDITSDASDIYIKTSNDEKVRVVIYGDKDKAKVNSDANTLNIESKSKKCFFFCIRINASKVEVYLPANYSGEISIKNDYGDIFIDKFASSNIKVKESCGDVEILAGKNVAVDNDYGDIEVKNSVSIDIKSSAGDVEIGTVTDAKIENNYGDITINNVTGYINIKEDCGDVEINNATITKNSYIKNSLGNIEIGNINEVHIDAKTDLGDVDINNNYKSDITLTIKNNCGDIEINN